MKIKIIDLLNMLAKDEVMPERIIYYGNIYKYNANDNFYYDSDGYSLYRQFCEFGDCLNDKVEIVEDDKPIIESISIIGKDIHKLENLEIYNIIEDIEAKLNEVIEFLNNKFNH